MDVCTLASGSSGNSTFLRTEHSRILIDAGISLRQLTKRLQEIDEDIESLDAVVITHEHSDHTHAIPKLRVPVYVVSSTAYLWEEKVASLKLFEPDRQFQINDLHITPFSVPHDAIDPVGFTIEADSYKKIGIATDIGSVTGLVTERLKGCNALVIEFNHDNEILSYSHYPWDLKQRIKGRLGHLSNNQASGLLESLLHSGLTNVTLAHLSQVNNRPEVALRSATTALRKYGIESEVTIGVAPRKTVGGVVRI